MDTIGDFVFYDHTTNKLMTVEEFILPNAEQLNDIVVSVKKLLENVTVAEALLTLSRSIAQCHGGSQATCDIASLAIVQLALRQWPDS